MRARIWLPSGHWPMAQGVLLSASAQGVLLSASANQLGSGPCSCEKSAANLIYKYLSKNLAVVGWQAVLWLRQIVLSVGALKLAIEHARFFPRTGN